MASLFAEGKGEADFDYFGFGGGVTTKKVILKARALWLGCPHLQTDRAHTHSLAQTDKERKGERERKISEYSQQKRISWLVAWCLYRCCSVCLHARTHSVRRLKRIAAEEDEDVCVCVCLGEGG